MDIRDRILRTYEHKPIDKVVWQPRIMYYYNKNKIIQLNQKNYTPEIQKYVPESFVGKEILQIYDEIRASIRYPAETLAMPIFYNQKTADAQIHTRVIPTADNDQIHELETPVGTITEKSKNGYHTEYFVKNVEDLKPALYLVQHSEWKFNELMFEAASEVMEKYGIPTSYYFRSPYQKCILELLGFPTTIKFLRKYPREMEQFMHELDLWDEKQYANAILNNPVKLLNFGENIDCELAPPRIFEKFHLPYYEKRVKMVHMANKYCFIHIDGSIGDLLPYLSRLPHDGLEALTPEPQGDVTVKQIADAIGDKILIDGIPATVFMPEFPESRLIDITKEILDRMGSHVILGVSDELSPNADGRRLKKVTDIVENYTNKN